MLQTLTSGRLTRVVAFALVFLVGFGSIAYLMTRSGPQVLKPPVVTNKVWTGEYPSVRTEINEEGRLNPGNPRHAEEDLEKWYRAIVAFRDTNGRLPDRNEFYGRKQSMMKISIGQEDCTTPDQTYADGLVHPQEGIYSPQFSLPRPDGRPKPANPGPGERDVWAYTTVYTRSNQVIHPDGRVDEKPSGCYVVLWSDGKIERVAADSGMLNWTGSEGELCFRGQAGLPESAISEKELRDKHAKREPK